MKRCGLCAFSSDDAAEFDQHMIAKHAWDKVRTRGTRSSWAARLFAAAGTAFIFMVFGVGFSGGGLSHGTLPEPINTVVAILTWVALLAVIVLLPAAVLAGLFSVVGSWVAPAPATPDVGALPETPRDGGVPRSEPAAVVTTPDRRGQRALVGLVALAIAAAYIWSETSANRSLEVMPFALVVLASSVVFTWLIFRTR